MPDTTRSNGPPAVVVQAGSARSLKAVRRRVAWGARRARGGQHMRRDVLDRDGGAHKRLEQRLRDCASAATDVKDLDRGVARKWHGRNHARKDRCPFAAARVIAGDPGAHIVRRLPMMVMVVAMMMMVVSMGVLVMMVVAVTVVVRLVRHQATPFAAFTTSECRRSIRRS